MSHENSLRPFEKPQVSYDRAGHYQVKLRLLNGQIAKFDRSLSPAEAFSEPPQVLEDPFQLVSLPRVLNTDEFSRESQAEILARPWTYEKTTKRGNRLRFLGTADHHELLYGLYQENSVLVSARDVLLNIDAHDDLPQSPIDLRKENIALDNFVAVGLSDEIKKAWDHYVWVAAPGSEDHAPKDPERYSSYNHGQLESAFKAAIDRAAQKGGKVIVSLDFDFFASQGLQNHMDEAQTAGFLLQLFQLINLYQDHIKLVHFTESLAYCRGLNLQVQSIYQKIAPMMKVI